VGVEAAGSEVLAEAAAEAEALQEAGSAGGKGW
jgi:hypothetical protein